MNEESFCAIDLNSQTQCYSCSELNANNSLIYTFSRLFIHSLVQSFFHSLLHSFFSFSFDICPDNWRYFQRYCYRKILGANIPSVHSQEENVFVQTLHGGENVWLGLSDINTEGTFVWSDRSQLNFNFFIEDCVHILGSLKNHEYKWNEMNCSSCHTYSCKKGIDSTSNGTMVNFIPPQRAAIFLFDNKQKKTILLRGRECRTQGDKPSYLNGDRETLTGESPAETSLVSNCGSGQIVHEVLKALFAVGCQGGVICKQQITYQHLVGLGLGTESGNIKEFAIMPRPDVHSIFAVGKRVLEEHREEDPE
ncbi:PREDICTED: C-type mannose receptor 2-like [Acropora digitifera]|uniref:C-type mannose receptor 2-like n=1 Tax=Acropora digitifera TaxID=70779 RepID=UPI00077A75C4|nr:PREDICTED: C-type mannose receptor 2-like [Acropora digitifera]